MRFSLMSSAIILLPRSEKHAPVTRPTYPTPTTHMLFIGAIDSFSCCFDIGCEVFSYHVIDFERGPLRRGRLPAVRCVQRNWFRDPRGKSGSYLPDTNPEWAWQDQECY